MKKVFLILIILLTTGCYDYKELNNLAIISGIAIDYDEVNNNYITTFEILNESDNDSKSYYVKGNGNSLIDSFNNASLSINKIPFYSHVKVMILSNNLLNNNTKDLIDFVIHNTKLSNTFYVVLADSNTANEILTTKLSNDDTISDTIYNLIDNKELSSNISLKVDFEKFSSLSLNDMQDLYLPVIKLNDNNISLNKIAIFSDTKLKDYLDENESKILNILLNESKSTYFSTSCNKNKDIIINVYDQSIKYNINNKKVVIYINLLANVSKNDCNYDLKENNKLITDKYNKLIKKESMTLINKLKKNDSDVLGINYKYYKNHNKKLNFNKLKYDINVDVKINNNGLIFEVKK